MEFDDGLKKICDEVVKRHINDKSYNMKEIMINSYENMLKDMRTITGIETTEIRDAMMAVVFYDTDGMSPKDFVEYLRTTDHDEWYEKCPLRHVRDFKEQPHIYDMMCRLVEFSKHDVLDRVFKHRLIVICICEYLIVEKK